jgi:hypothetical protein
VRRNATDGAAKDELDLQIFQSESVAKRTDDVIDLTEV